MHKEQLIKKKRENNQKERNNFNPLLIMIFMNIFENRLTQANLAEITVDWAVFRPFKCLY